MPGQRGRVLVVCAHWSDNPDAIDQAAAAFAPLKAEGTTGVALIYGSDDDARRFYDGMRAIADAAPESRTEES